MDGKWWISQTSSFWSGCCRFLTTKWDKPIHLWGDYSTSRPLLMADVTSIEVGIDKFLEDMWGYVGICERICGDIHHLFWENSYQHGCHVFKTVRSFLNFQWLKSKSWKTRRFFSKFCHTFVPASDASFCWDPMNLPKSSQQDMRARSSHAFNQIFMKKWR